MSGSNDHSKFLTIQIFKYFRKREQRYSAFRKPCGKSGFSIGTRCKNIWGITIMMSNDLMCLLNYQIKTDIYY